MSLDRPCSKCGKASPEVEFGFYMHKARQKRYRNSKCKTCARNRVRDHMLLKKYGMTRSRVEALHQQQDGKCAICLREMPALGKGSHVDHCHSTGKVRGLLCRACNHGLGQFQDSPETLRRAAKYLLR